MSDRDKLNFAFFYLQIYIYGFQITEYLCHA